MPTIVHKKNYLYKQKFINLSLTFLSLFVMLFFYLIYKIYSNSTITMYLVLAALCAIPAAQFATRYIILFPHKDSNIQIADDLLKLPSYCYVINTALFTDGKVDKFIDSIAIINNTILCFVDNSKKHSIDAVNVLENILKSKDIEYNLKSISTKDYNEHILNEYMVYECNDIIKTNNDIIKTNSEELFKIIKSYLI